MSSAAPSEPSVRYRPDIDGLRAISILAVVFYHADLGCPGGYVGVDVFFVISGFLITQVLTKSLRAEKFSYLEFWERRIRRLLPAFLTMAVITSVFCSVIFTPDDLKHLGIALNSQAILIANVYDWKYVKHGYFGNFAESQPLLHTWSLALEEQFYFLFPSLLYLCYRKPTSRPYLHKVVLATFACSLLLCLALTQKHAAAAFFLLPSRAWELLAGSLLALAQKRGRDDRGKEIVAWLGLAGIILPILFYDKNTVFPGYAALAPVLGAAAVIFAGGSNQTFVGRLLSQPILVQIGLISYSLYLWHWPVFSLYRYFHGSISPTHACGLVLAALTVSYFSWRYIEKPFRAQLLQSRKSAYLMAGFSAACCVGMGCFFYLSNGIPSRWGPEALHFAEASRDRDLFQDMGDSGGFSSTIGSKEAKAWSFLVWGDSHGVALLPVLAHIAERNGMKGINCNLVATAPLIHWTHKDSRAQMKVSPEEQKIRAQRILDLIQERHIKIVFLAGYWSVYSTETIADNLKLTVAEIRKRGAKVCIVEDVPTYPMDIPTFLAKDRQWGSGQAISGQTLSQHQQKNREIHRAFESLGASVTVVDPALRFTDDHGNCIVELNGEALYCDDNHLSVKGSLYLEPVFETLLTPPN